MSEFMRTQELSRILGVSTRAVQRMVRLKRIPAVNIGRSIVVPRSAFEIWMKEQENTALATLKREGDTDAQAIAA